MAYRTLLASLTLLLCACGTGGEGGPQDMPPAAVGMEVAAAQDLPLSLGYSARTAGSREVEVRARVSGIVEKRLYVEGAEVKVGTPLFRIDPEPFRAAVAQARAELGVEEARLNAARRERDRFVSLAAEGLVSQRQRDEAVSGFEIAEASVASAAARLRLAEIDLGHTEVRAPITGLTGHELLSEGSLVNAGEDSSLLTNLVQVDPLFVGFYVPSDEAPRLREAMKSGGPLTVQLLTSLGPIDDRVATIDFVDPAVDVRSGTVLVRATVANKDRRLSPGQFVRAVVSGVVLRNVIAVPRRALMSAAEGQSLWVVDSTGHAQPRAVKVAQLVGDQAVLSEGLAAGERYVVEGIMKVQPGMAVVQSATP